MIIIHAGGNDMGIDSLRRFRFNIKYAVTNLSQMLPSTLLVWSQILPRRYWRYMLSLEAGESNRIRINNFASTKVINMGGAYIKYPELKNCSSDLYKPDGVHLTKLGNEIFLNTLQGAIYTFINTLQHVYPQLY